MTAPSRFSMTIALFATLLVTSIIGCDRNEAPNEEQEESTTTATSQRQEQTPSDDGMPPNLEAGQSASYGSPISSGVEPLSLSEALESCVGTSEPCVVRAEVDKSCQSMGCWLTMKAPGVDATIRVKMADYGFFVPANAGDCIATFEGTLEQITLTQAQAQHYADDEVGDDGQPRTVTGPEPAWEWTITGIELTRPQVL